MAFSLEDLKPLADLLLEKGAPLLATALLGPIGGSIANAICPSLAQAFGLTTGASPTELAKAIQADPEADAKLKQVQEEHSELLDWAQKSLDANQAALNVEPSFLGRLYVGGWRPAMGWTGVWTAIYQTLASVRSWPLVPIDHFIGIMGIWSGLAGIRTVEFVKGVARTSLSTIAKKAVRRG